MTDLDRTAIAEAGRRTACVRAADAACVDPVDLGWNMPTGHRTTIRTALPWPGRNPTLRMWDDGSVDIESC